MNLLEETLDTLKAMSKSPADVMWVGVKDVYLSFEEFASIAKDFEYDEGFGSQEVDGTLVVVGEDWWLERHEYDGSEEWRYKERPWRSHTHVSEDKRRKLNKGLLKCQ